MSRLDEIRRDIDELIAEYERLVSEGKSTDEVTEKIMQLDEEYVELMNE